MLPKVDAVAVVKPGAAATDIEDGACMPKANPLNPVRACHACGSSSVDRDRVVLPRKIPAIDAVACHDCGDWWFESAGERLTADAIVRLGLTG